MEGETQCGAVVPRRESRATTCKLVTKTRLTGSETCNVILLLKLGLVASGRLDGGVDALKLEKRKGRGEGC